MDEREIDEALEPLRELIQRAKHFEVNKKITYKNKQMEVQAMASFDFESLKKKVTETATTIVGKSTEVAKSVAGKSTEAAKNVAGKAQSVAKKTKLNAEIAAEREGLKKKYQEIGKLYYEKYAGNTDPDFAQTVEEIEASLEKINAKQAEIEALDVEPEVEIEVEETIIDEIEDTIEETIIEAEREAEAVAEDAAKIVEESVLAAEMTEPETQE